MKQFSISPISQTGQCILQSVDRRGNADIPEISVQFPLEAAKDVVKATSEYKTPEEQAEQILSTLERQKFADWYNSGNFDNYISGDLPPVLKEQIIQDIIKLFQLAPQSPY